MTIKTKSYARIGLMGNPSDGYFGKTISCAITNYCVEVNLQESTTLQIVPNSELDPTQFSSLSELNQLAKRDGYYGGLRLILASCKKFKDYCDQQKIDFANKNFTISYETDIPRQVGLGGSSAIITATLKALMQFYGLTDQEIPKQIQPNLVLSVETEELEIDAGLQDRVIQVYGGTVFMDFSKDLMTNQGYGNYQYLDSSLIPNLFLAYLSQPVDSGKVHSNLKYRYQQNDQQVVTAMKTFAQYASQCKEALSHQDVDQVSHLMDQNFDLRRKILGDHVIGKENLEMINIARHCGCAAKFSGSGGAIIGLYQTQEQFEELENLYRQHGFAFTKITIDPTP